LRVTIARSSVTAYRCPERAPEVGEGGKVSRLTLKRALAVILSLVLLSLGVIVAGCAATSSATSEITDVSAARAYQLIMENEGNRKFVVLDVRTPEEFVDGHIADAVNVDFNSGRFRNDVDREPRANIYLVYCRTGNRSRQAVAIMKELHFQTIYHLSNGIVELAGQALPIVK
jgi:rhodanese-related sulfurtransferase